MVTYLDGRAVRFGFHSNDVEQILFLAAVLTGTLYRDTFVYHGQVLEPSR